jgi:hypothetical protein
MYHSPTEHNAALTVRQGLEISKPAQGLHDPAAVIALKNLKDKVQTELQKYRLSRSRPRPRRHTHDSDFTRLARHLCGKAVGLVLGGGGARGFAHVVRPHCSDHTIFFLTDSRGSFVPWKRMGFQ